MIYQSSRLSSRIPQIYVASVHTERLFATTAISAPRRSTTISDCGLPNANPCRTAVVAAASFLSRSHTRPSLRRPLLQLRWLHRSSVPEGGAAPVLVLGEQRHSAESLAARLAAILLDVGMRLQMSAQVAPVREGARTLRTLGRLFAWRVRTGGGGKHRAVEEEEEEGEEREEKDG